MHPKNIGRLALPLFTLALASCAQPTSPQSVAATGDYVSADYNQRDAGYDWLAVSLSSTQQGQLLVSVRARNDRKQPSCTFDGYAQQTGPQTYALSVQGQTITLTVTPTQLSIKANHAKGDSALAYYCSGGATLAGTYHKLAAPLDRHQLDPRPFTPGA